MSSTPKWVPSTGINNSGCGNTTGCQLGVWAINRRRHELELYGGFGRRFAHRLFRFGRRSGDYPQNWYDQGIAVDPNNPDRVFIDTFDTWFATRTGTSFYDHHLRL